MKTRFVRIGAILLVLSLALPEIQAGSNPFLRPINNVNLSLFGDASILSLNYERFFVNNRKFFLAGRIGVGYSESQGLPAENTSLVGFPLHLTGNYGERKHYFEFGLGSTLLFYGKMDYWDFALYPVVGYRFQPYKKDKFSFRLFASYPLTDKIDIKNYWFFPIGVSVGFCF